MTPSSWACRSRRIAALGSVLAVIVFVAGSVILANGGLPDAWWPHTGQAFAAGARPAHHDPCAVIVGPAKAYCASGAATGRRETARGAWRLGFAGAGVAGLVVWRLRSAAGQRRR